MYFHGNDMEMTYQMVIDSFSLGRSDWTSEKNIFLKKVVQHCIQWAKPQLTWSGADESPLSVGGWTRWPMVLRHKTLGDDLLCNVAHTHIGCLSFTASRQFT